MTFSETLGYCLLKVETNDMPDRPLPKPTERRPFFNDPLWLSIRSTDSFSTSIRSDASQICSHNGVGTSFPMSRTKRVTE